ncbi:hypothetical protein FACS1894110_15920 [Spirochaetia bacterium]|nr:hypothetical protein FACS1894110_15920 [Spirochaetia bacterium]
MKIFEKIDGFLFIASMFLVVLIIVVTVFVSRFFINELIELTINNLFSKQDIIVNMVSRELEENPRMISRMLSVHNYPDNNNYPEFFKNVKSELPYSKFIWFTVWDDEGNIQETISEFKWRIDLQYINEKWSADDITVSFSNNAVIHIGQPYRDSMNISSMVPVFIDHYEGMKIKTSLFIETNLSNLLYNAKRMRNSYDASSYPGYSVSIYSPDLRLIETTDNDPLIKIIPIDVAAHKADLTDEEILLIQARSKYYRISRDIIELYSLTATGYIIRGTIPYDFIMSKINSLILLILGIGITALVLLLVIGNIMIYYRRLKEKQIYLKIETIQAKLDPHFLFNTLNSMVGLVVDNNTDRLMRSFKSLSVLLRSIIAIKDNNVTLHDELEYIQSYVDIQHLRYEDEFEYCCTVDDESLLDVYIPRFSIQPIIENCFVHAVAVKENEGDKIYINLHAKRSGKIMHIDITNNGDDCTEAMRILAQKLNAKRENDSETRIGLTLINREIKMLYGIKFGLELLDVPENNFFSIRIKLPAVNQKEE